MLANISGKVAYTDAIGHRTEISSLETGVVSSKNDGTAQLSSILRGYGVGNKVSLDDLSTFLKIQVEMILMEYSKRFTFLSMVFQK